MSCDRLMDPVAMLEEVAGWMDLLPIGLLELDSLSNQSMIVAIC